MVAVGADDVVFIGIHHDMHGFCSRFDKIGGFGLGEKCLFSISSWVQPVKIIFVRSAECKKALECAVRVAAGGEVFDDADVFDAVWDWISDGI